jgi:predicted CopG family antitoxin
MTKTISLSDEAYKALAGLKRPGESFSDVALRVAGEQKRSIMDLAGTWAMSEREADALKARIRKDRDASLRPRYGNR